MSLKLALISKKISKEYLSKKIAVDYGNVSIDFFEKLPQSFECWNDKSVYSSIILDLSFCKETNFSIINEIRETPLILIVDDITDKNERTLLEESIIRGAEGFVEKDITDEQLQKVIYPQFDRLKFCDSYTNIIIDSFVTFHSSLDLSSKMISIAKIVCRRYEIPNDQRADIYRSLKILSVAIKTNSIIKTIRFFEDIRIAKTLLRLLKSSIKPDCIKSNIIHMIYNFTRVLHHNRGLREYVTKSGDMKVYDEILAIFERKEVFIERGSNLESIWIDLIEATSVCDIDYANSVDDFIRFANTISKYSIIYSRGAIVKIVKNSGFLEYQLVLQNEHSVVDEICTQIKEEIKNSDRVALVKIEKNITLSLKIEKSLEEEDSTIALNRSIEGKEEETSQENIKLNFSDGAKRDKTSAVDYCEKVRQEIDIDDYLDTLLHLESDVEDIITSEIKLSQDTLSKASEIFSKYGSFLGELPEFSDLSYVVFTLASVLRNTDFNSLEKNEKLIYKMLVSVLEDLKNWKITNFITQDSLDIHYLDDSLLSSCSQLESIINKKDNQSQEEDDDDDGLELF